MNDGTGFVTGPNADCAGTCFGSSEIDECGVCEGNGIADGACDCDGTLPAENFDCDGNCLVNTDCAGECGGDAVVDECGVCDGDGLSCAGDDGDGLAGIPSDWDSDGDGLFDNINLYQNSGSITSRVFLEGVDVGSEGDVLAAFVGGEQRGISTANLVPNPLGGGYAFLLLVYSNEASGETITFQFYDAETDTVYDVDQTYEFVSSMTIGNSVNPEQLMLSIPYNGGYPFVWDSNGDGLFDNINSYQNSGSITSRIYLDGLEIGSEGDVLAAFVNGEQRGFISASSIPVPLGGGYAFLLLVYSNEASGETITFQFYDSETDTIYDINEQYEFVSDMVLGNVTNSESFNITTSIDVSAECFAGWNWMSLNVVADDMSIDAVFSSLDDSAEFIKNQAFYADYYDGFGWFGTLTDINNVSMYKLRMSEDALFSLTGMPAEVEETVFDLGAGFNWIGYTPQFSLDIGTALANIPAGNAEFIKSQSFYSDYYDSFGWFGTLETMDPLLGYVISLSEATQFTYNEDDLARVSSVMMDISDDRFDLNIHDYEHNATITSAVYVDGHRVGDNYTLAAFDGSICVGYADGLYFPLDGSTIFPLMVYGNDEGSDLTFRIYDNISGDYMDVDKSIAFVPDMKLGDGFSPVEFNNVENPDNYTISSAYPNPFNPVVNFDLDLNGSQHVLVKVYNISGQEVAVLQDGKLSGFNKITWTAGNQSSGIYFMQVTIDGQMIANNKVMLIK